MKNLTDCEVPDKELSYSELKDRIIAECVRSLPAKERILLMAKKLEEDLTLKDANILAITYFRVTSDLTEYLNMAYGFRNRFCSSTSFSFNCSVSGVLL